MYYVRRVGTYTAMRCAQCTCSSGMRSVSRYLTFGTYSVQASTACALSYLDRSSLNPIDPLNFFTLPPLSILKEDQSVAQRCCNVFVQTYAVLLPLASPFT